MYISVAYVLGAERYEIQSLGLFFSSVVFLVILEVSHRKKKSGAFWSF